MVAAADLKSAGLRPWGFESPCSYLLSRATSRIGGMVDTVDSKSTAARHVGSSPTFGIFYFVRFPGITNQNGKVSTETPPCYAPQEQVAKAATQSEPSAQP
jgi:hypothetical protein